MLEIQTKQLEMPAKVISSLCELSHIPILQMMLLQVRNNTLSLTGSDSQIEVNYLLPIDCNDDASMTIPAKKFADIVKTLKHKVLSIKADGQKVKLTSGSSRFTLNGLPTQDYPVSRDFTGTKKSCNISGREFAGALNRVAHSMAKNDVRYYLNSVFLDIQGQDLHLVATDGHRLATEKLTIENPIHYQAILPRTLVLKLQSILDKYTKEIQITGDDGLIEFKLENCVIRSQVIDGKYPEWQSVIPQQSPIQVIVKNKPLRDALKRADILANEKFKGVRLHFKGTTLTIESRNSESESCIEELEIEDIGSDIEVGFNLTYLLQALESLQSDVQLRLSDDERGSILLMVGNACCVIMPMRI